MLKVTLNGKESRVRAGIRIEELLAQQPHPGHFPALGAIVNKRVVSLSYPLKSDADIVSIDLTHREGMDIYRRTASMMLYAALREVADDATIEVGQSIGTGYFFEIAGIKVDQHLRDRLERSMITLVTKNIPIHVEWTTVEAAIEHFSKLGCADKVKLLSQRRRSEVPLVQLQNFSDLAHGPLASRTGLVDRFTLSLYEHGIVLDFPDESGKLADGVAAQPKLFATYLETKRWNELVKTRNVADLNEHCMRGTISDLVKVTEALHEKKIAAIADQIAANRNIRVVFIAGPSASGKTTFAKRLVVQLKVHGIEPQEISLDSYYRPRDEIPRHADGRLDFEHPAAIDLPLINDHLQKLLAGQEVAKSAYSFQTGNHQPHKVRTLRLDPGHILIVEGIHGLNDAIGVRVPQMYKFKIFVSALTQLCIDSHNRIFTTDTRLCRRIVRDRVFRGATAAETISFWPSVRLGEQKYIFPYQEGADVIFNSALIYEHALLKTYAERFLVEVPRDHASFMEAYRLLRFFSSFIPILPDEVPHTSILREFIGKSAFQYT